MKTSLTKCLKVYLNNFKMFTFVLYTGLPGNIYTLPGNLEIDNLDKKKPGKN